MNFVANNASKASDRVLVENLVTECDKSPIMVWVRGETTDVPPPWLVYINLSNHCNNLCYYCAHSFAMRSTKGRMDFDLFKKIVDGLPESARKVYLIKQGEPFAHPKLEEFTAYLREQRPDVHISIHTNAIIAKEKRVIDVLPNVDSFGISISAMDAETYRSVHETDKFDVVLKNLDGISRATEALPKDKRPHVFIDYVIGDRNAHEDRDDVISFFSERFPGLASVDFHYMFNYTGEIGEANLEAYDVVPYEEFPICVFPWSSITYLHDGKLSYCFVEPRENRFLGDVNEQTFDEIWNGEEYKLFRERMMQRKFGELADDGFACNKCSWLWSPHSMAPRNLAYGYATDIGGENEIPHFADLLQAFPLETFQRGAHFFLSGETHHAFSCMSVVISTTDDQELIDAATKIQNMCREILQRYQNLSKWFDILAKEGRDPESRRNIYNSTGG